MKSPRKCIGIYQKLQQCSIKEGTIVLKIENIQYKADNEEILQDVTFEFQKGKFYVITGHNGAGKSTLAKCLMGLYKCSGKIFLNGEDITNKSVDERANLGMGFAFQQPVTFKGVRVIDLLKIANKSYQDYENILRKVGLDPKEYLFRELNATLSGGELKRLELASVLSRDLKVGIFDEPEAGIDLWSFNNLSQVFSEFQNTERTTIVISHQERVMNLADEIIVMKDGKILKSGTRDEVLPTLNL